MNQSSPTETIDTILNGRLRLIQPRRGYRFSVEAILLGRFVQPRRRDRVLELGAGCGVVSIMLAALNDPREVVAIEIQPELAAQIERNAVLNGLKSIRAVCVDLRKRKLPGIDPASFDLVVANPPFRARGTGRRSPEPGRRIAREEAMATLEDFVRAAHRLARHGARIGFVFSAARSAELIALMRTNSLEPKRIRFVHPHPDAPASIVMVEGRADGGVELRVEPPLFLHSAKGGYSREARLLLGSG